MGVVMISFDYKYICSMNDTNGNPPITAASRHDAPQHDLSRHTLTIKQASQLFTDLGVPRSIRSIQRFCENGSVDSIRVKGEKTERNFINQESVERYAKELLQLEHISRIEDDTSRHDTTQRDITRHDAPRRDAPQNIDSQELVSEAPREMLAFKARIDILEKEKLQLQIDRSAKEQVIGHIMDERRDMVDRLTEQSREIGRLETQLLQLAAPQRDTSRHDATDDDTTDPIPDEKVNDASVVVPEPVAPVEVEAPRRSIWGKIFR